jgi:hypothetical protein
MKVYKVNNKFFKCKDDAQYYLKNQYKLIKASRDLLISVIDRFDADFRRDCLIIYTYWAGERYKHVVKIETVEVE